MFNVLKLKHLSLVTLVVYLVWIFPVAQLCLTPDWVERPEQQTVHGLSQLTSVAQPVKHHVLSDDDDQGLVQLHSAVEVSAFYPAVQYLQPVIRAVALVFFSARAPPEQLI